MEYGGLWDTDLDVLEDRQDLSQYSYDPDDRLDAVIFPDSQQSSQATDKTDVFLGVSDDVDQKTRTPADEVDWDDMLNDNSTDLVCHLPDYTSGIDEQTTVTALPVHTDQVNPVSASQDVTSLLRWQGTYEQTFNVEVF